MSYGMTEMDYRMEEAEARYDDMVNDLLGDEGWLLENFWSEYLADFTKRVQAIVDRTGIDLGDWSPIDAAYRFFETVSLVDYEEENEIARYTDTVRECAKDILSEEDW